MLLEGAEPSPEFASIASSPPQEIEPTASHGGRIDNGQGLPRASLQLVLAHVREIARGHALWSDPREACGLSVQSEERDGKAWLYLGGELDFASQPLVEECIALAQDEHDTVVVDLEDLTFMDSCGIDAFLHAAMRAEENGGHFHVANSHMHRRLFLITDTASLLEERGTSEQVSSLSTQVMESSHGPMAG